MIIKHPLIFRFKQKSILILKFSTIIENTIKPSNYKEIKPMIMTKNDKKTHFTSTTHIS